MARILVIDDDPVLRELLSLHLSGDSHAVTVAADPVEALTSILHAPPDLVICDLGLPYLHGLELLSAIKKDAASSRLPVIVLSCSEDERDWRSAKELGACAYLTKPAKIDEIRAEIAKALR